MSKILVIEDEENLALLYKSVLERNGFTAYLTKNGEEGLALMEKVQVDLIITDVMMPVLDGFKFLEYLKAAGYEIPILMITAKESFEDKKRGFRLGVDDYMVKPIDVEEMLLRVEALLRRAKINHEKIVTIGSTVLDQTMYLVTEATGKSELPQKEFQLLYKLLSYPNRIFTRQQLMDDIWGLDSDTDERTIDVHIKRLRDRFSQNGDFELVTIRGLGYKAVIRS